MFDAIVCTVSTGRVRRRRFGSRRAAEAWVRQLEAVARQFRRGLRGIRVELYHVAV
jgi:hypothetical protein